MQLELGERIGYSANPLLHLAQIAVGLNLIYAPSEAEMVVMKNAISIISTAMLRKGEKCFLM